MKKIFTLLVLVLAAVGSMKAEDVVLFDADFSQAPYVGTTLEDQSTTGGIYVAGSGCSISDQGIMTYHTAGNMSSSRYLAIKLSNINSSFTVTFKMNAQNDQIRYNVGEETEYNKTTANTKIADLKAGSSATCTVTYTMAGEGTDAILYFGRASSNSTSGLKGITITTPDTSSTITHEITEVIINGAALDNDQLSTLISSKNLTINDEFEGLPTVKYTITTTTTSEGNSSSTIDEYTANVVEDGNNYSATLVNNSENYVITFTGVTVISVLEVTEKTTVLLTKENIKSKDYLSTTTENWQTGKTYANISGDFYNLSSSDRKINIVVKGASYVEAFVSNSNAGRSYKLAGTTINHGGTGVESSGFIAISSEEGTISFEGTGSSVYPVYVVFYTELPTVPVTIAACGYGTLVSEQALDFESNNYGVTAYIATGLSNGKVQTQAVTKVPANTGLILKGTAGTYEIPVLTGDAEDVSANKMMGSATTATTLAANQGYILYTDGKFHPCNAGDLPAGKAYLNIEASSSKVLDIDIEDPTAISAVESELQTGAVYTLQGVRVSNAAQKGVYIVNGKKVVK